MAHRDTLAQPGSACERCPRLQGDRSGEPGSSSRLGDACEAVARWRARPLRPRGPASPAQETAAERPRPLTFPRRFQTGSPAARAGSEGKGKTRLSGAFLGADDGIRTHDLLHGKAVSRGDSNRQEATNGLAPPFRVGSQRLELPRTDTQG